MESEAIGWTNTALPVAALMALALLLPRLLVPRRTRSHAVVALGIAGAAGLILAAGVAIFLLSYRAAGADLAGAFEARPLATWLFFTRASAMAALGWGPVLALVWFGLAQGVETRRGADAARRG
jgi:hypothetical protein